MAGYSFHQCTAGSHFNVVVIVHGVHCLVKKLVLEVLFKYNIPDMYNKFTLSHSFSFNVMENTWYFP